MSLINTKTKILLAAKAGFVLSFLYSVAGEISSSSTSAADDDGMSLLQLRHDMTTKVLPGGAAVTGMDTKSLPVSHVAVTVMREAILVSLVCAIIYVMMADGSKSEKEAPDTKKAPTKQAPKKAPTKQAPLSGPRTMAPRPWPTKLAATAPPTPMAVKRAEWKKANNETPMVQEEEAFVRLPPGLAPPPPGLELTTPAAGAAALPPWRTRKVDDLTVDSAAVPELIPAPEELIPAPVEE